MILMGYNVTHDWLFIDAEVFNVTTVHLNRLTVINLQLTVENYEADST